MSITNVKVETDFDFTTGDNPLMSRIYDIANNKNYLILSEDEYKLAMEREAQKLIEELSVK